MTTVKLALPPLVTIARTRCRRCDEWITVLHTPAKTQRCPGCGAVLIETVARL
jgi:ribosomal protein S27E